MNPIWLDESNLPEEIKIKEKTIFEEKAKAKAKNSETAKKISEGLYKKWLSEVCLLEQEFVNPDAEKKKQYLLL